MAAAILATVAFLSCSKSKKESITTEQQTLLDKMKVDYRKAKTADDSLISFSTMAIHDTLMMNFYDSCYHAADLEFTNCHTEIMNSDG